jgi:phage/plasmid-associated DNA primase
MMNNLFYDNITNISNSCLDAVFKFYSKYKDQYVLNIVKDKDVWYEFTDCWKEISYDILIKRIIGFINHNFIYMAKTHHEVCVQLQNWEIIAKLLFESKTTIHDAVDLNIDLLGFQNGVYDLENKLFRPKLPQDMICMSVGYDYLDLSADFDSIDQLTRILDKCIPDKTVQSYILDTISTFLDGKCHSDKFNFWIGEPTSPEMNLLIELIKCTLGDYCKVLPGSILTKRHALPSPELVNIEKARCIIFENDENFRNAFNSGMVKEMSAPEPVVFRRIFYKKPLPRQNKVIILAEANNNFPRINYNDLGTWRRTYITEFIKFDNSLNLLNPHTFKQAFIWLLLNKHYQHHSNRKHDLPPHIKNLQNKYRDQDNPVKEFFYTLDDDAKAIPMNKIYEIFHIFKEWHRDKYGVNARINRKEFIIKFKQCIA